MKQLAFGAYGSLQALHVDRERREREREREEEGSKGEKTVADVQFKVLNSVADDYGTCG